MFAASLSLALLTLDGPWMCLCTFLSYSCNHVVMLSSILFSAVLALVPCCARFLKLLSEPGSRSLEISDRFWRYNYTSIKHFGFKAHLQPTKPQLDFHAHCQCSSFQNTCHLSTWHMSVSMVSDCIQNSFKSKK